MVTLDHVPWTEPKEVADKLADFFNCISREYEQLLEADVPKTYTRPNSLLSPQDILDKLKKTKKPSSTVPGDIPALLYGKFAPRLAPHIAKVFNLIVSTKSWPDLWKIEYVTLIPKIPSPQDPSDCRNISCTNFLSKLFESFVL